jgi:hypothetical protein
VASCHVYVTRTPDYVYSDTTRVRSHYACTLSPRCARVYVPGGARPRTYARTPLAGEESGELPAARPAHLAYAPNRSTELNTGSLCNRAASPTFFQWKARKRSFDQIRRS